MQLPQSGEHRRLWRAVTCQSLRLVDDDVVEVTLGQDVARAWIEIAARNAYSPLAELVTFRAYELMGLPPESALEDG